MTADNNALSKHRLKDCVKWCLRYWTDKWKKKKRKV